MFISIEQLAQRFATLRRSVEERFCEASRSKQRRAFAALFVVVIGAGALVTGARLLRDAADAPWASARFEAFFHDRLAGRDTFASAHARLKVHTFGASPTPRVVLGRDGWLFYHHEAEEAYLRDGDPALERRLDRWAEALPAWRCWLAERGVPFLVVVAPDKQSVYPELLPAARRPRAGRPLNRVLARWRADPELTVLDLRGPLAAAKAREPVYLQTDSHWSPAGQYVAYAATAAALARWHPGPAPRTRADFEERRYGLPGGDLWRLVGLPGPCAETYTMLRPLGRDYAHLRPEPVTVEENGRLKHLQAGAWERDDGLGPRVVLLHDSFGGELYRTLLAEHCSRMVAVPARQPDRAVIERERPDVVVLLFVERALQAEGRDPPSPDPRPSVQSAAR